ncbi:DNA-3-methyladenine glycosylase 2 family protein, partial [Kineococcus sp. T13]|nr:DNA-3-methyladenine glycosylase 2 family protein [Kineococcus vitellinus]
MSAAEQPGQPGQPGCSGQPLVLRWRPGFRVDVRATLAVLRRGAGDPTHRLEADGSLWRAT